MKKIALLTVLTALAITGCGLFQAKINMDYKRDDLNQAVVDSLDVFVNDYYKMNPEYTNDFIVAYIRLNTLNAENVKVIAPTSLKLFATKNKDYVKEDWIKEHLDKGLLKDFQKALPQGLTTYNSIEEIVSSDTLLSHAQVCSTHEMDANWALFSATGNTEVIDKLLDSRFIMGRACYFSVLEWSLYSRATQNKEVYDKITQRPHSERITPPLHECRWNNR